MSDRRNHHRAPQRAARALTRYGIGYQKALALVRADPTVDWERLDTLPDRQRHLLSVLYGLTGEKPRTLEGAAAKFGLTRERVRQLRDEALDTLGRELRYEITVLCAGGAATTTTVTGLQAAREFARGEIESVSGVTLGELHEFLAAAARLDATGGRIGPLPDGAFITVTPAGAVRQLDEELRGVFADGWTDEDLDRVLPRLEDTLGLRFACVWEYVDAWGFGGHSNLVVLHEDGSARELPDGLWAYLVDRAGDGQINPATIGQRPHPDVTPAELADYESGLGYNLVYEDRTADTDDDTGHDGDVDAETLADAIDRLPAERVLSLWENHTQVMLDLRDHGRRKWADADEWAAVADQVNRPAEK